LNCGQTIWDKYEVILGTFWRTTWELKETFSSMMGTICEQGRNKISRLYPPPKEKKVGRLMNAC
jgi:hypothetical protein